MSDTQFPRICDLRPHTVVELPDGNAVRLLDTDVPAKIEVMTRLGVVLPINATVRVKVLATPEHLAAAFLQSLPDPAGAVEYGVVIAWGRGFKPTDIRGATPDEVLGKYAQRNPLDAPVDPVRGKRKAYIARYLGQQGLTLSFGSWQEIDIQDGLYCLKADEGPRSITFSPLEMGG